jgi:ABC-2 type transport system ATP-binding protein
MADPAIETARLWKTFGEKVAVEDLTLEVHRGEVFGFLGPNGAGKSTSVKMLLGLVVPTGGEARVLGRALGDVQTRRHLGFLPEHFRFHDWLTADEFLQLHGRLLHIEPDRLRRRADELLDRVGLTSHRDKRLGDYSKGMLQRVGLAQALLNTPDVILLDEPTSGLDPVGRRLVRDIIHEQKDRGATVFLNSHLLGEVEITCDRVAFINHGKILEVHELHDLAASEITVTVRADGLDPEAVEGLETWADDVRLDGDHLSFNIAGEEALPEVLRHLVSHGANIYSFTPQKLSLEEVFIRIVGEEGGL